MWKICISAYLTIHAIGYTIAESQDIEAIIDGLVGWQQPQNNAQFSAENALPCDGFLTANPSDNFCSESVPEDWREFDFAGQTFYLVPLATPDHATNQPWKMQGISE